MVRVGDMIAEVDEELAPLIEALWRNGFTTISCCQDVAEGLQDLVPEQPHLARYVAAREGYASIDFPVDDGLAFMAAIANAGPRDAFYVRMIHWAAPGAWDAAVKLDDIAADHETRESEFDLWMLQVCFPRYDIEEIERRLANHEAGHTVPPASVDWTTVEF
jgi:hypothetical protein